MLSRNDSTFQYTTEYFSEGKIFVSRLDGWVRTSLSDFSFSSKLLAHTLPATLRSISQSTQMMMTEPPPPMIAIMIAILGARTRR